MPTQSQKLKKLKLILRKMGSVLVAFSGGVDSTLLLEIVSDVLPKNKILAVTANSATYPPDELTFAKEIAKDIGIRHKVIRTNELKEKRFVSNPVNRCYFCKIELFTRLNHIAAQEKLNFVCDATNVSDKLDFRPGDKAKKELKVRSPLEEAGLHKEDIRKLSKKLGLITWDKPSLACLASRVPYGSRITEEALKKINQGENILKKMGFSQVRLRHYNGLCRIEVAKDRVSDLLTKRNQIVDNLKKLGYNYVTVDLEGYRTGSLNEAIKK